MALAETAALVASLELQDKFSKTAAKFDSTVAKMDSRTRSLERIGENIGRGARNTIDNLRRGAVIAGGLIAANVAIGVRSLAELEEAEAQTAARIKSTGGAANVTAAQVRDLAEELENLSTVDDKAIQAGENMLLTFTNIRNEVGEGNDIFNQATKAVLDLSVAMKTEPQQAALQLGKALNDPIRGLTALRRVGVQFTEQQETQIKRMVESGRVMDAQKVILAELTKEFGGSAEAFSKGPGATLRRFGDAVEDAQQALARGFLPLMERVATMAQDAFSDPKVIDGITKFGSELAGGLDDVVDIATRLPWDAIGNSLRIAGAGAKALLGAFTSMPDWVQTAVLTGWGLNKLTGGALGNIAGELTKMAFGGLRGGTPATPVFTKEVGLPGGGTGGAPVAAGGRLGGALATGAKFILGPLAAVAIGSEIAAAINGPKIEAGRKFAQGTIEAVIKGGNVEDIKGKLDVVKSQLEQANDPLARIALETSALPVIGDALGHAKTTLEGMRDELQDELNELNAKSSAFASSSSQAWSKAQSQAYAQLNATNRASQTLSARLDRVSAGVAAARDRIGSGFQSTNAQLGVSNNRLAAIQAKDFSPNIGVTVNASTSVSVSDVIRSVTHASFASQVRHGFTEGLA
jgi:hypothetical protein